jgi:hypothetical protein
VVAPHASDAEDQAELNTWLSELYWIGNLKSKKRKECFVPIFRRPSFILKRQFVVVLFLLALSVRAFAKKDDGDFPLVVHVTAVNMEQGENGVSGSGSTDSNGNYSSSVGGGGSYTWKLYTAQIEGDPKIYELDTPRTHYLGGPAVSTATVIGTMGWGALFVNRSNHSLHIGDYHGRWNKNGTLEIQFVDEKGKLVHQPFSIQAEAATPNPSLVPITHPTGTVANVSVDSNVSGADIEIDGTFVGNTPSTVSVAPGSHQIAVKKKGYTGWSKTVNVTGGTVHLNAELEQEPVKQ